MHSPGTTLASPRRQFEAMKRRCARVIAAAQQRPSANQIVELWHIAEANVQPVPNPLFCVRKFDEAGFRRRTFHF